MIAEGWAADLVFLDAGYCHYTPLRASLDQIVFAENGAELRDIVVAGRYVIPEGCVLTMDEAALAGRARDAAERLAAANLQTRPTNESACVVVQSYCRAGCTAHRLPTD